MVQTAFELVFFVNPYPSKNMLVFGDTNPVFLVHLKFSAYNLKFYTLIFIERPITQKAQSLTPIIVVVVLYGKQPWSCGDLTTPFLGRLRPPERLSSTECTCFRL